MGEARPWGGGGEPFLRRLLPPGSEEAPEAWVLESLSRQFGP